MSRDIVKAWPRQMLLLTLLLSANGQSHQSSFTGDVTADSDDVCISGCICSATAIICKRDDVLTSFPVLPSAAASSVSDMWIENQNLLTNITADNLRIYPKLAHLTVIRSGLRWLGRDTFQYSRHLQSLDLRSNQLSVVLWSTILNETTVNSLAVQGNPLSCNCTARWFQRVLRRSPSFLGRSDVTVTCFDDVTERPRDINDVDFTNCAVPMLTVIPNVTDVRRVDNGQSTESTCRGFGDGVMVRWNTSELGPDVQFNVTCVDDLSACRLRLRGPLSPVHVHCIAANDVGNDVHAWTLYASGPVKPADMIKYMPFRQRASVTRQNQPASADSASKDDVTAHSEALKMAPDSPEGASSRLVIAVVSVCGLLLITSLGVMLTVVRRWRRLKHDRDGSEVGVQLDDLVKLLCYTGRRRRRRGTAGRGAKPLDSGRQPTPLADHGELVQLALRSQTVGGGVMEENERYASAADINTRGGVQYIARGQVKLVRQLGEGEFGSVYLGVCDQFPAPGDVTTVAVKAPKLLAASGLAAYDEILRDFEREAELLDGLRHENIISLYGISIDEAPLLILEFMENGDLNKFLRAHGPDAAMLSTSVGVSNRDPTSGSGVDAKQLTIPQLLSVACQIAAGVEYMSSLHFVHRDLATRNCLVGQRLKVKIGDFGMSRDLYSSDYFKVGDRCMLPVRWLPPESLLYRTFTVDSDIWSYGVVLWEIFTYGRQPWFELSNHEVIQRIQSGTSLLPPRCCPPEVRRVMTGCWRRQPDERLRMTEIRRALDAALRRLATSSPHDHVTGNHCDNEYLELLDT